MSATSNVFIEPPAASPSTRKNTLVRLLISLAFFIFLAEVITMIILYYLQVPNYVMNTLLDGAFMLVLIFPGLYILQVRPILRKMKEHEQAETALRTSQAHLLRIMEAMPVGVWIVNKNGEITHGNPAGKEIWAGFRYVDMSGYDVYKSTWAKTGLPVKAEEWGAARAVARGETSTNEEINIEAFDGSQKVILNSAAPLYDEKNTIMGAVVVNQDITLLRQIENESARTNALLERFFNSIHIMVAYVDREFNFIRVNKAYADSAGHPIEYFMGKNHFTLYPHVENEAIFRQVVETGQPYIVFEKPFEYPEFPERGVTYWDWSLQPVMGLDQKVEGLVLSLVDVSRRKLAELQLERQNQELRQLTETEHRQRVLAEGMVQSVITLNTSLDLDQVLISVLEQTRKAIPFQGADILLVKEGTWRVAACLGFEKYPQVGPDMKTRYTLEDFPLLAQVCSSQQMVVKDSVLEYPGWRSDPELSWVCSFAAVPLITNGSVIGIVELYDERYAAFGKDTAGRLVALTAPAALAIYNARLYHAELEAHQVAETMRAAAQALSKTLDMEQVIHTLLDHIQRIVSCDTSGFTLMEGEDRWILRASRGYKAWADQEDIPTAPHELIDELLDIQNPDKVLILERAASGAQHENGGPASIQRWAILPLIVNETMIGFVELGKAGQDLFRPDQMRWAEALVMEASVAIQNAWLFEQARSSSLRLQSLARKLVELQEKERHHIARELHDEAGQVLSSLKLSLAQTGLDPDCPAHIRQRLQDSMKVTDLVLEDLHRLAMDLRPVALDHLGLVPALLQLANEVNASGVIVKLKALGLEGVRLPADVETSLYRIVQEALANILRHARACNVGILLERENGRLKLFVEDDGIGFNPHEMSNGDQLGLVGMRERAEMLGGNLTVESSPGIGTSIIVEVPDGDSYSHHG